MREITVNAHIRGSAEGGTAECVGFSKTNYVRRGEHVRTRKNFNNQENVNFQGKKEIKKPHKSGFFNKFWLTNVTTGVIIKVSNLLNNKKGVRHVLFL